MFIPKRHRDWKPGKPETRCHWCTKGPFKYGQMIMVLESPMHFRFCQESCCVEWQEHRHDRDMVEWLKIGAGERAKILREVE